MNMTVDEARILKREAELAIVDIMNTLMEATDCQIDKLDFDICGSTSSSPYPIIQLNLELQIK